MSTAPINIFRILTLLVGFATCLLGGGVIYSSYNTDRAQFHHKLTEERQKISALESQVATLQQSLLNLEKRTSLWQEETSKQLQTFKDDSTAWQEQRSKLTEQVDQIKTSLQDGTTEREQLTARLDDLKNDLLSWQKEYTTAFTKLTIATQDLDKNMTSVNNTLQQKLDQGFATQFNALKDEVSSLQKNFPTPTNKLP